MLYLINIMIDTIQEKIHLFISLYKLETLAIIHFLKTYFLL